MSQTFRRYANTVTRIGFAGIFLGPPALLFAAAQFNWSPYVTQVNAEREQPVPFSHQHHVRDLGLDCRYCHTTVEKSAYANIPPIKTCMTCHSQIWRNSPMLAPIRDSYASGVPVQWTRVHQLPDFVYFNHSIHVSKGFGCSTCHGRVDLMPITYRAQPLHMAWCLHCHRDPQKFVRPESQIYQMDWQPPKNQDVLGKQLVKQNHIQRLQDCDVCHR